MTEPAFLALGDIHLNPFIWLKFRDVTGDTFLSLESLVDLASELYLPIVLLGDIFDSIKPTPEVMQFFRQQMDRCREENIPVYAIQGNHDKRTTPWYVACHDHVRHIGDGKQVNINGIDCVGFDYQLKDEIQESLTELGSRDEKPDCLFLHQACKQALRFEGKWNCDLEWVPEEVPLIIMGDIHTEWSQKVRTGQWAYYTGPGSARDIKQIGPKSCILVNRDLTIERLPIPSRVFNKFVFTAVDQVDQLEKWVEDVSQTEQPLPPVSWVVYTPECSAKVSRIAESAENLIVIKEMVESPESIDVDDFTDRESVDELISVEALLAKLVDPDSESFVYQMVLDLLEQKVSILDVIKSRREQFIAN